MANANKQEPTLDSGYVDNFKFNRDMDRLLAQANDALRSIRSLSDLLARHPEALIKGRPEGPLEGAQPGATAGLPDWVCWQRSAPAPRRARSFTRSRRLRGKYRPAG